MIWAWSFQLACAPVDREEWGATAQVVCALQSFEGAMQTLSGARGILSQVMSMFQGLINMMEDIN